MKKSDTEQEQPGLEENKVPVYSGSSGDRCPVGRHCSAGEQAQWRGQGRPGTGREGTPGRDILRRTTARAT